MRGGIAVVTSGFPRRSETFLLNELLALDARGALAAVFATKPGDGGSLHPGCRRLLRRVEVLPGGSPSAQAASLLERLGARRVAGVHGYFAHRPAAVAAHAARRLGVPFGFSVHARDARKVAPPVLAARERRAASTSPPSWRGWARHPASCRMGSTRIASGRVRSRAGSRSACWPWAAWSRRRASRL